MWEGGGKVYHMTRPASLLNGDYKRKTPRKEVQGRMERKSISGNRVSHPLSVLRLEVWRMGGRNSNGQGVAKGGARHAVSLYGFTNSIRQSFGKV